MTVSEQEVKDQIAEMRQALVVAQEARRRAGIIKLVGTVAGIVIVVLFVWLFIKIGLDAKNNVDDYSAAITKRIKTAQVASKVEKIAVGAMPLVQQEGTRLLNELKDDKETWAEAQAFLNEDVLPMLEAKTKNEVFPKVQALAEAQFEGMQEDLMALLEGKFKKRVEEIAQTQATNLELGTGLNEQQIDKILGNLRTCCQDAAWEMMAERGDKVWAKIEEIKKHRDELLERFDAEDVKDVDLRDVILRILGYQILEQVPGVEGIDRTEAHDKAAQEATG
jgi:hypothetical protein